MSNYIQKERRWMREEARLEADFRRAARGERRENDRGRTTYVVEVRCQDCEGARSWMIDNLGRDDWTDAFENVGDDIRHWLSDHHENTHTEEP